MWQNHLTCREPPSVGHTIPWWREPPKSESSMLSLERGGSVSLIPKQMEFPRGGANHTPSSSPAFYPAVQHVRGANHGNLTELLGVLESLFANKIEVFLRDSARLALTPFCQIAIAWGGVTPWLLTFELAVAGCPQRFASCLRGFLPRGWVP